MTPLVRDRAATLLAVIAALVASGIAVPALAHAEWDIGQYDRCIAEVKFQYREGDISTADMVLGYDSCCRISGGQVETNGCGAPPAVAANTPSATPSEAANPDVPAGPPPPKAGPKPPTPRTPPTLIPSTPLAPVG